MNGENFFFIFKTPQQRHNNRLAMTTEMSVFYREKERAGRDNGNVTVDVRRKENRKSEPSKWRRKRKNVDL